MSAKPPLSLRDLPSVDAVVEQLRGLEAPRALIVGETRRVLAQMREEMRDGGAHGPGAADRVRGSLARLESHSLRQIINATGVILHTNLGRAPLPKGSVESTYSNLEYDLAAGRRGKRDAHLSPLIERLATRPGIVVNNNAAAVLLALHTLAAGGEVIVSRGELIEIGDGFRIPDIMAASGATLREAGTTNRTHIDDYRFAIGDRTRLLLRVHPSNFHVEGFTAKPPLSELAGLARERGLPLYEDLGSGCVVDLRPYGIREPLVSESIDAGVNLISFSGDKLLGGPQAGFLAGDPEIVAKLRRNPLFRALRIDKLTTLALETTLRLLVFERYDEIPALRMIRMTADQVRERAERIRERIPSLGLVEGRSLVGGGSTPDQSLPTWLLTIPGDAVAMEQKLRMPEAPVLPVIARIEDDCVVIDLRTVAPDEEDYLTAALNALSAL